MARTVSQLSLLLLIRCHIIDVAAPLMMPAMASYVTPYEARRERR